MNGNLIAAVADHGRLNSPWGLAAAPASFGRFGGCLLVGNFGDGRINAYCLDEDSEYHPQGTLRQDQRPVEIDGLWGIGFGNNGGAGLNARAKWEERYPLKATSWHRVPS